MALRIFGKNFWEFWEKVDCVIVSDFIGFKNFCIMLKLRLNFHLTNKFTLLAFRIQNFCTLVKKIDFKMKKANFTRFVQEGRLIEFQFEPEPMRDVLNEILQLLANNDSRISTIESEISGYASKKEIEQLEEKNQQLQKNLDDVSAKYDKLISDFGEKFDKKLEEMSKFVEDSNSVLLVDVRRYMQSQIDDVMKFLDNSRNNGNESNVPRNDNNNDQGLSDLILKDINELRKTVETKINSDQLKAELLPIFHDLKRVDEHDADLLTLKVSLEELTQNLTNLDSNMKKPGTRVEVVVQKPIQPAAPPPKREVPPPPARPPRPTLEPLPINSETTHSFSLSQAQIQDLLHQHSQVQRILSTPFFQQPLEETASIDRQVRRLNEMTNNYKYSLEEVVNKMSSIEEKLNQAIAQNNIKHLQVVQDVEQIRSYADRLKEQLSVLSGKDYTKQFEELNSKLDSVHKEVNDVNDKADKKNKVVRPDIRYVERTLPPLQTQSDIDQVTNDNDNFGLLDSSESPHNSKHGSMVRIPPISKQNPDELGNNVPSPSLTPEQLSYRTSKGSTMREDYSIKIFRTPMSRNSNNNATVSQILAAPTFSIEEIQEKVDHAIKASIAGFLERSKLETQKEVEKALKVVDQVSAKIEQKIDREFVERLFNKFRVVVSDLKDKIDQIQCTFLGWVTREELEEVLERFVEQLQEVKDTAGASSKYKCLLCGRPRTHISGMIVNDMLKSDLDEEMMDSEPPVQQKVTKRSGSRIQTPKTPKRSQNPMPRDVIQFLTSTDARK
ncbi:hypothetical protein TRFO_40349 [Tritrichomonas foetus]|uniref:Uncharacterized protein n=1 Tax=Tritrichomonas foetus TaxID=1144522 RepID=A0A1J4J6S3_9EUKA|nr:hypothetical protein TRFO_40349 [Tritrichomonas foetus]|eukprot:OHS93355.1 hypothetical protein TRFO_40349 [Tritrichomonas foetus]